MPSWPPFRTWLQQFAGQDNELGALAADLDPRKPWDRGMWSVRKYEAYLKDAGATDEVLGVLEAAWERWQGERPESADREADGHDVSKYHPHPQRRPSGDAIAVVVITGTSAKTEVVTREEFGRRLPTAIVERYDGKQYAVLRPAEIRTWRATAGAGQVTS